MTAWLKCFDGEPPIEPIDLCPCGSGLEADCAIPGVPRRRCCRACREEYEEQDADRLFDDAEWLDGRHQWSA